MSKNVEVQKGTGGNMMILAIIIGLVFLICMADNAGGSGVSAAKQKQGWGGRCNGDCENCPPHYGYRYGRYYYGHDHHHGCEFGGNRGGGSMD